jgi:hypothetical protein
MSEKPTEQPPQIPPAQPPYNQQPTGQYPQYPQYPQQPPPGYYQQPPQNYYQRPPTPTQVQRHYTRPKPSKDLPTWVIAVSIFATIIVIGVVIIIALSSTGSSSSVSTVEVVSAPTKSASSTTAVSKPAISGLGISRETASSHFQGLGYSFKDSPLNDGRQRAVGFITGNAPMIELIGDPDNLSASSLTLAVKTGDKLSNENSIYYLSDFLKFFLPGWGDGYDWVKNNLVNASTISEGLKNYVVGNQVTLQAINTSDGALVIVSVKALK